MKLRIYNTLNRLLCSLFDHPMREVPNRFDQCSCQRYTVDLCEPRHDPTLKMLYDMAKERGNL